MGDHPGVVLTERPAPVGGPATQRAAVIDDRSQPGHPGADQSDRARRWRRSCGPARWRTHVPALTASAARPRPARRQPAVSSRRAARFRSSPQSPRPARATAAHPGASRRSPARSVAYRPRSSTLSSGAVTSIVTDRLCGSMPMITRSILSSSLETQYLCRAGRAALLRAEQTPLEPLPAQQPRPPQTMREPHDGSWAADERATGRAPGPSLAQVPVLGP